MRLKIQEVLEQLRPMLQADGGDVEFVDYLNHYVTVRLVGACHGCPHATMTLKHGIEARLIEEYPEILGVIEEG